MGMFDTVKFPCPSCGHVIEEQSKAGECNLDEFGCGAVPMIIAGDILGHFVACQCGRNWVIRRDLPAEATVALTLEPE